MTGRPLLEALEPLLDVDLDAGDVIYCAHRPAQVDERPDDAVSSTPGGPPAGLRPPRNPR